LYGYPGVADADPLGLFVAFGGQGRVAVAVTKRERFTRSERGGGAVTHEQELGGARRRGEADLAVLGGVGARHGADATGARPNGA
jgi:hypothetical protein